MTHKWLAFDIETSKITEDGHNLEAERPLGICCYALAWSVDGEIKVLTGNGRYDDGSHAERMRQFDCAALVDYLHHLTQDEGYTLLTHNGVGFDLDILAEESGLHDACVELAMNSVDTMLHFHCLKGFPVGLDAIAKGTGLSGKTEGMHGDLAPVMWARGEYDKVLEYVGQDVISTLEMAVAVEKAGVARWISKSGRLNSVRIPEWLTVREALQLPLPNTSWMDEPWPREKFTGWMQFPRTIA